MFRFVLLLACAATVAAQDTDRDGLPDLAETHKYFTDPAKKDSDGDGKPDGDWDERREYAYTVRSVVRVMPPYDKTALDDDYQDVRVRAENKRYIELEVVHYPFNTWAQAIEGRRGWRKAATKMRKGLAAGVTTNWDQKMQRALHEELAARGIDPEKMTDEAFVRGTAAWLLKRGSYRKMFCTYYVHFPRRKAAVLPGLEKKFADDQGDPSWSMQQQFDHELFGRGMFANKSYGSCTSAAVYLTTGLRAAGVPTRMVLAIPVVDASDPAQVALVDKLTHRGVRTVVAKAMRKLGTSFSAHTYNEVFVGGRWVRLNYSRLGQNIHDPHMFGLVTHVHRFRDLSEARLAETWGKRYALGERSKEFPGSNPYRTLELSDGFGAHAAVRTAAIDRLFWYGDDPKYKSSWMGRDKRGYLLVRLAGSGDLVAFARGADNRFVLKAKGHPDVPARDIGNGWERGRVILLLIDEAAYARMPKGVSYTLTARNAQAHLQWRIAAALTIAKK